MSGTMEPDVAEALKQLKQGFANTPAPAPAPAVGPQPRPQIGPASGPPPAKVPRTVPGGGQNKGGAPNFGPAPRPAGMQPSFRPPMNVAMQGGKGGGSGAPQIGPQIGPSLAPASTGGGAPQIGPQIGPSPNPNAGGGGGSAGGGCGGAAAGNQSSVVGGSLAGGLGGSGSGTTAAGGMTGLALNAGMPGGLGGGLGNLGAGGLGAGGMAGLGGIGAAGGAQGIGGAAGLAALAPNLASAAPGMGASTASLGAAGLPGLQGLPNLPGLGGTGGIPGAGVPANAAVAKTQVRVEVPQASVGLLIGKQAVTINAIKAYSKANVFVEQQTPDEGRATVTIVGSQDEITKAKRVVDGLVDGSMSTSVLYQMAGVGSGPASTPATMPAPGLAMAGTVGGLRPPGLGGAGLLGVGLQSGIMPPMPQMPSPMQAQSTLPPPALPAAAGVGLAAASMQDHLNDYYAQWWAQCGNRQPEGEGEKKQQDQQPAAFDKAALEKLAQQAKEPKNEAFDPAALAKLAQQAADRASSALVDSRREDDDMDIDDDDDPAKPPAPTLPAPLPSGPPPGTNSGPPPPPSAAPPSSQAAPPGPPQETAAAAFARFAQQNAATQAHRGPKDNDSVQKMLQTLQGNAAANKDSGGQAASQAAMVAAQAAAQAAAAAASASAPPMPPPAVAAAFEHRNSVDTSVVDSLEQRAQAARMSEEVDSVGKEVLARLRDLPPDQAVDLLTRVDSIVRRLRNDHLKELGSVLSMRLRQSTSTQFALLMSTFILWSTDARERFSEKANELIGVVTSEMSERLMELAPAEVNCCLTALMALGYADCKFLAAVCRACVARHNSFGPGQLATLLSVLAELRLVHSDLFQAAGQAASIRARELRAGETMRLMRAFAKCNQQHEALCQAIGDHVTSRWKAKGIKSGYKCEELCELVWTFCVLQSYHEDLFRLMFKQLHETPKVSNDALCQLYEIHLALDSEHKEAYAPYKIEQETVQALLEHYTKHRKDVRRCSERQRSDVASALKSLTEAHVQTNHRTGTGMLVDVAALRKRTSTDGFVHVELDSPYTAIRPIDQDDVQQSQLVVEGPVALRRRILQKNGLKLITVREAEWRQLDESKEKRRHLRGQLSSLGAGLVE